MMKRELLLSCILSMLAACVAATCNSAVTATGAPITISSGSCATVVGSAGTSTLITVTSAAFTQLVLQGPGDLSVVFATGQAMSTTGDLVTVSGAAVGHLAVTHLGSWTIASGCAVSVGSLAPASLVFTGEASVSLVATSLVCSAAVVSGLSVDLGFAVSTSGVLLSAPALAGTTAITLNGAIAASTVVGVSGAISGDATLLLGSGCAATLSGPLLAAASASQLTLRALDGAAVTTSGSTIVSVTGTMSGSILLGAAMFSGGTAAQISVGTLVPAAFTLTGTSFSAAGSNFRVTTLLADNQPPLMFSNVALTSAGAQGNIFDIAAMGASVLSLTGCRLAATPFDRTTSTNWKHDWNWGWGRDPTWSSNVFNIGTSRGAVIVVTATPDAPVDIAGQSIVRMSAPNAVLAFYCAVTDPTALLNINAGLTAFALYARAVTLMTRVLGVTIDDSGYGFFYAADDYPTIALLPGTYINQTNMSLIGHKKNQVANLNLSTTGATVAVATVLYLQVSQLSGSAFSFTNSLIIARDAFFSLMTMQQSSLALTNTTVVLTSGITWRPRSKSDEWNGADWRGPSWWTNNLAAIAVGYAESSAVTATNVTLIAATGFAVEAMISIGSGQSFSLAMDGLTMPTSGAGSAVVTNIALGSFTRFNLRLTSASLSATSANVVMQGIAASQDVVISGSSFTITGPSVAKANIFLPRGVPAGGHFILADLQFASIGFTVSMGGKYFPKRFKGWRGFDKISWKQKNDADDDDDDYQGINSDYQLLNMTNVNVTLLPASSGASGLVHASGMGNVTVAVSLVSVDFVASSATQTVVGILIDKVSADYRQSRFTAQRVVITDVSRFARSTVGLMVAGIDKHNLAGSSILVESCSFVNMTQRSFVFQGPQSNWDAVNVVVRCAEMRAIGSSALVAYPINFGGALKGTSSLTIDSVLFSGTPSGLVAAVYEALMSTPARLTVSIARSYFDIAPMLALNPERVSVVYGCSRWKTARLEASRFQWNLASVAGSLDCTLFKTFCYRTSQTPSKSESGSASLTASESPSVTPSSSGTPSRSPTVSPTASPSNSKSKSRSITPTVTPTLSHSRSPSPSETPSNSRTTTPTISTTPTTSDSPTDTPTASPTYSATVTKSNTVTMSGNVSSTKSLTVTMSSNITESRSPNISMSLTTATETPSRRQQTLSITLTPSRSPSDTPTLTPSKSPSRSPSLTPSPNVTITISRLISTTHSKNVTVSSRITNTTTLRASLTSSINATKSENVAVTATRTKLLSTSLRMTLSRNITLTKSRNVTRSRSLALTQTIFVDFGGVSTTSTVSTSEVALSGELWTQALAAGEDVNAMIIAGLAASLNVSSTDIELISVTVGSLIVVFRVNNQASNPTLSGTSLATILSSPTTYQTVMEYYYNVTGQRSAVTTVLLNVQVSSSTPSPTVVVAIPDSTLPNSVTIGVIAGSAALAMIIVSAGIVWWIFFRRCKNIAKMHMPDEQENSPFQQRVGAPTHSATAQTA